MNKPAKRSYSPSLDGRKESRGNREERDEPFGPHQSSCLSVKAEGSGPDPGCYQSPRDAFSYLIDFLGIVVEGKGYKSKEMCDSVHAEYVTVPEEALSLKPRTLNMEPAGAIGVPFSTAWFALRRAAERGSTAK